LDRPKAYMFQNLYDFLSILNECNNFHLRSTFWTLKRINLINFIDQLSPGFPACLWRRSIIQYLYLNIILIAIHYSTLLSLPPGCVRVKAVIANERLIGIGNVQTDLWRNSIASNTSKLRFFPRCIRDL